MSNSEKYSQLAKNIKKYERDIPGLESQLNEKKAQQENLEEEALTAEILEEQDWKDKKEKADRNREEIRKIKEEIQKRIKAVEILKKEQGKYFV